MIQGIQDETYVLLMDDDGEMREDLQVPSVIYKTDDDFKHGVTEVTSGERYALLSFPMLEGMKGYDN